MRISDWGSDVCSSDLMGSLSRDETVLIHNAGGGVGLACIDVARHIGAHIIGTASSGKHAFLEERGLHAAIDYRTQDWPTELRRLTDGRGVEQIGRASCGEGGCPHG